MILEKKEFVKAIAENTGYSQGSVKEFIKGYKKAMIDSLKAGYDVNIEGLGLAYLDYVEGTDNPRTIYNPKLGKEIPMESTEPYNRLKFKLSPTLKKEIRTATMGNPFTE